MCLSLLWPLWVYSFECQLNRARPRNIMGFYQTGSGSLENLRALSRELGCQKSKSGCFSLRKDSIV